MKNERVYFLFLAFIFISGIIIFRLFNLQVKNGSYWKALARGQQTIFKEESPERGDIFFGDKDGNYYLVATNKKEYFCYLIPQLIKDKEGVAEFLSQSLSLSKKDLLKKINKEETYFIVKEDISPEEMEKINNFRSEGVGIGEKEVRFYPQNKLGAHLLGFVGGEGKGQYGIEGFYDDELSGKKGEIFGERDVKGILTFLYKNKSFLPQDGSDLYLTIDYYIQSEAEKLLSEAAKNLEIEGGQIIVEDPQTGAIKALASWPEYDPNDYAQFKVSDFINPAIQLLFEPGSVFKSITMATGIDLGKITPETKYVDKGYVKIGGYIIYNYGRRVWGEKNMIEVLEKSINTGAVFAEKKIPHKYFLDYIKKFGFFEKTGIDLEGEIFSENRELKKGYEINFATASFGQGIEVTPIQLVRAYGAIANGGNLMKPFLVKEIRRKNGKIIVKKPMIQKKKIITPQTSEALKKMLVQVIQKGYGKKAGIPGYFIAGKTGTSQVPWASLGIKKKGYSDKTWQTFIGFFPAFHPQFLILVKLDNPKTKTSEYSAAPIFHDLAQFIINYWQIPPDYNPEK